MGFINWLNLRKYIKRGTDSEVARIGHVNAVYDALSGGGPIPTKFVTEITADGNGPYFDEVAIDVEQTSSIGTDYKLNVTDNGSGFILGIDVPYHEVIGTVSFTSNTGTSAPTLGIVVCNTIGNGSTDWSIAYETTGSGHQYVLSFAGDNTLYRNGILLSTPLQGSGTSGSYNLLPLGGFGGAFINIAFVEDYVSGLSTIRRQVVDTSGNAPANFNFH